MQRILLKACWAVWAVWIVLGAASMAGETGTGLTARYYDTADLSGAPLVRTDATVDFNWGTGSPDPAILPDTFSVQWLGQIEARYSETYTFYTLSDDGVRLWIDGQPVISNWGNHSAVEDSGTFQMEAGQFYNVVLEMYENTGHAVAKLSWSSASQPKEVVPQSVLYPQNEVAVAGTGDGLKGTYFPSIDFRGGRRLRARMRWWTSTGRVQGRRRGFRRTGSARSGRGRWGRSSASRTVLRCARTTGRGCTSAGR
jgi:hypothetical protein